MLIDSHCHLHRLHLTDQNDLEAVLKEAKAKDIGHILCVGVTLEETNTILVIAKQYGNISCTTGLHPSESADKEPTVEDIVASAAKDPLIVGIGETGLDYHYDDISPTQQKERFITHIEAAKQLKKPLIIHLRIATKDLLDILKAEKVGEVGGVMHCFTDTLETAKQCLDLGLYIGISGIITFNQGENVRTVAKHIPLDRLLIETDAPYLAPVPKRGKPNVPAYLRYTAEYLAELRGLSLETLAKQTSKNFQNLFFTR